MMGQAYGVRIGIRATDPSVLDLVRERLPPGWKPARGPIVDLLYSLVVGGPDPKHPGLRRYHIAYADAVRLRRSLELEDILDDLETDMGRYLAETAPRHIFVHAGVVGWKGKAILIPGRTLSGKTSLVAALVRAGATYLSDEFAVLDARGRVHPYPRALGIRTSPTAKQLRLPPAELGVVGDRPLPVGLVLSSRYRPGARWRPKELSSAQAAMELLANTIPARNRPHAVLSVLAKALESARAFKGARGEADSLAPRLLESADPR